MALLFSLTSCNIHVNYLKLKIIRYLKCILKKGWSKEINIRVGHGYDVHKFVKGRKLILGGCEIPFRLGLLGHSDADVLVHAIIDSLLGACALGDIGVLFPDTDDRFLEINSLVLLKEVHKKLKNSGFKVVNIDCTIVAQAPKLNSYIPGMCKNISSVLCIDFSSISIKATTEENLGFTGSLGGIKSYSVCLVERIS